MIDIGEFFIYLSGTVIVLSIIEVLLKSGENDDD